MEITLTSAALMCVVLVSIFGTLLAYSFINWLWLNPKRLEKSLRQQGLSGSPYRILLGDTNDERMMYRKATSKPINVSDDIVPRVLPFQTQHIKKYGDKSFAWMCVTPRLYVLEPALVKEIFTRIDEFHKPPTDPTFKKLAGGIITLNDEKWVKHRKLLSPAFHLQKLKNMETSFHLCADEMMRKWETLASEDGSCELDVWPDLQNLTRDVISRTAFGSSFEEGRRIFELQRDMANIFVQVSNLAQIPGYRWLPTKQNRKAKEMEKEIETKLRTIIAKREQAMKTGTGASDDLLGILIESNLNEMKEHNNDKSVGMSIEDVIEECKLFYFAGQETTAVLLVWTMVLLSQHKKWQERARAEVHQVFGDENPPHVDGLSQLKILNMIIHEVLRLYAPASSVDRVTCKETKLGNYTIPAGVRVTIPVLLLHHDRKIWGEDADEFKPERFVDGVSKASNGHVAFVPFGWGPKICIGMNFSLLEAKVALAMILQKFSFELSPSYTHAPYSIVTTQPQHGAHLILKKYSL
uniref:Cytochrome P450 72A n=1 Tax=Sedum lineare TaxID=114260 RepID=A0A482LUR8_SEDLI|nr:cytochrome P450 72A [Sedum lineare]